MKRNVVSVKSQTPLGEAAKLLVQKHVGMLPVIDDESKLVGMLSLAEMLELFLPAFVSLMDNVDFVHDFGVLEEVRIDPAVRRQPVSEVMHEPISVEESTGLIRAYTMMLKHDLHDLPIVKPDGVLVGIASRVDVGTAFLSGWQTGPLTPPEER
jgi:CBS-domain-containing membrane protein